MQSQVVADLFGRRRLTLVAGPCVIESYELCLETGRAAQAIAAAHGLPYIFKSSFDKANRTSIASPRGPGLQEGLQILAQLRRDLGVPVLTDVHLPAQAAAAAEVVDILQIPAFLCRQTDLIAAVAATGRPTNIKKGQFLAPEDMRHPVTKFRECGGTDVAVTERGVSFGYHNLVVDMRGLVTMREVTGAAVIFDATHSVQRPSAGDGCTGGDRYMAPVLARAAAAVGIDGLYCEVHPRPDQALSDGPNTVDFAQLDEMLADVCAIDEVRRSCGRGDHTGAVSRP